MPPSTCLVRFIEYWLKRDPIERFADTSWSRSNGSPRTNIRSWSPKSTRTLKASARKAEASPMPSPQTDAKHQGAYCEGNCHTVLPKYAEVKFG